MVKVEVEMADAVVVVVVTEVHRKDTQRVTRRVTRTLVCI